METHTYRKKPVEIEAFRILGLWTETPNLTLSYPRWLIEAIKVRDVVIFPTGFEVRTLEGVMRGETGDWIIRGIVGEIYPCKNDIFNATYEKS